MATTIDSIRRPHARHQAENRADGKTGKGTNLARSAPKGPRQKGAAAKPLASCHGEYV